MNEIIRARDRSSTRRAVRVRCEAVAERGFRWLGRTLHDLSIDGAFLETEAGADIGEEVFLAFQVPRTRAWIDVVAQVVRRVPGRRARDRVRGVGLRFGPLEPGERAFLEAALAPLPAPAPARPPRADYASSVRAIGAPR